MKVYLVNLERRPDRLQEMTEQLNSLGIEFERIDAVDGNHIKNSTDYFSPKRFFLENRRNYVPGEVGCALSHINIWKKIVYENIDYALVLEDDVIITNKMTDFIDSTIYKNFDYLKIDFEISVDGALLIKHQSSKLPIRYNHPIPDKATYKIFDIFSEDTFTACECDPVPYYTGGYVISRHGAERFLAIATNMYYAIDLLPRYATDRVKQGFLISALAKHKEEDSDISGRIFNEKLTISDKFLFVFHKIFNRRRLREIEFIYWAKK